MPSFDKRSMKRIAESVHVTENLPLDLTRRKRRTAGGTGGGRDVFFAKITAWNSGTSDYTWNTMERNEDNDGWDNDADGLSSTGSSTGTKTEEKAIHDGGVPELLGGGSYLIVDMYSYVDAGGTLRYMFTIPLQLDPTFTHRTDLAYTDFNMGVREDHTWTEAELQDISATPATAPNSAAHSLGQGAGGIGWVVTESVPRPPAYDSDETDPNLYGYVRDVEYDVLWRKVSVSKVFRYVISDTEVCS